MFFLIGGHFFTIGGIFSNWEAMGAYVFVEIENVFLIGGIFYNWGQIIIRENQLFWELYGPLPVGGWLI